METAMQPATRVSSRMRTVFGVALIAALLFVGVGLFANGNRTLQAAPSDTAISIRYISVREDGASAQAWYAGAPGSGVPIQDALDHFAKQGYRVSEVTRRIERTEASASVWAILLERVK